MTRRSILPALLLLMAVAAGTGTPRQARAAGAYKLGAHIADFKFKSDTGKTVRLSDYRGRLVVLVMFGTW